MNESVTETIARLMRDGFTGQVTIHMANGTVKEVVEQKRWRPPAERNQPVDLTEAGK